MIDGAPPGAPVLRAEGLTREVGGRRLVDEVSFAVAPGEILALVGPSGAGSATFRRTFRSTWWNGSGRPSTWRTVSCS